MPGLETTIKVLNIPHISIQDFIATWQPVHRDSSLSNVIFKAVDPEDDNLIAQSQPIYFDLSLTPGDTTIVRIS